MLSFSFTKFEFYSYLLILNLSFGFSQILKTVIDDVTNRLFTSAEQKLLSNSQDSQLIAAVVHNVYSNTQNNTKLILDFAHDVNLTSLSFQILRELNNEMTVNNHSDPLDLIELYRAFENDVIFKTDGPPHVSKELKSLLGKIKDNVRTATKRVLKAALYSNQFEGSPYVRKVAHELFNFYYEISDEVMIELVNETYPQVPATQLADNIMHGSDYIPQQIAFFIALYEKLEASNDLNNDAVLKIAYYVRILKKLDKYRNLFQPKKYEINAIIKRMPICAKNLYFAFNLCLWNRGRSEYLYAASSQHNLSRRGIFTYGSTELTIRGIWEAEFFANVYFKNSVYDKEYLYASTSDRYDRNTRHVLTWVDDGFVGDTSAWKIELNGDFCYIKNVNFNEYLYTSDRIYEEKKRYVFTAITQPLLDQKDFQWQIRNCG